ncbi:MAG: glycosyltransferase [Proteobacteria bacterium]|nr:glycosyltransferase [Pseudomonadota bacterium]
MNALMRLAREMTPASATVAGLVVGELSRVAWGLAQRGGLASVHPKRPDPNRTYPRLSLIVPARNEGLTIDACLTGAAGQDYPDLEILVVDDCSQDDTAARVRAFAAVDPRVRLVSGATLPSGWAGKPWALHQGVHASTGEWLLFVDADTNLHQGAVTAVVDAARDGWIGLNDGPDGPTVVMIRRTARGHHSGQFAFPGGRPEIVDIDLCATAMREAYEEVGINPADVTILGSLPTVETITTNYAITAYVGRLGSPPVLVRQPDEVAEILEIPLATFLAPGLPITEDWDLPLPGEPWTAPPEGATPEQRRRAIRFYPWGANRIWGATARMIEHLVIAIRSGRITPGTNPTA